MRGTRAETSPPLSPSVTAKWIQRGGRREKDGEGEEEEDGNENGGGGGVTEMFRRQTMDAPFVRSFVRHSLARKETRGMLHSKEGAAAAAEEWKRRGRRCCYGTIDARYLRKKDGRSGGGKGVSLSISLLSRAVPREKRAADRSTTEAICDRRRPLCTRGRGRRRESYATPTRQRRRRTRTTAIATRAPLDLRYISARRTGSLCHQFKGVAREF